MRHLAHTIADLQTKTLEEGQCLVHYDLTEDHIYLNDQGGLEGIIDFGDARIGRPSNEFPVLFVNCLGCDDSLITAFREAYDDKSEHYQIGDEDLAEAIRRHDYRADMMASIQRSNTSFAGFLKSKV